MQDSAYPSSPDPLWQGTSRYAVQGCIGEGGMGVVYEAIDLDRGQRVAVKKLLRFSPDALYRFKQEFRTLADVVHPNLVRLHELVVGDDETVFFTMELVRGGITFREHVLASVDPTVVGDVPTTVRVTPDFDPRLCTSEQAPCQIRRASNMLASEDLARDRAQVPSKPSPADFDRLRPALRQLVEGVQALHLAGKLHRDIKPSNVLVTPEGRVVVLDFGVATELGRAFEGENVAREVVGTIRYMAPEQATDDAPTTASDWYSVGVMLYEALAGGAPFDGSNIDVLTQKSMLDAPRASDSAMGIPADLDQLCSDLLRSDPAARPTGVQILERLSRRSQRPAATPLPAAQALSDAPLIGRKEHLAALGRALVDARGGRPVAVLVHGASGMGKSALVQHFIDWLAVQEAAVVLRGRVYEREMVPYKALDSIIDALTRRLTHLIDNRVDLALPDGVWALARLFPVLRSVASIALVNEPVIADPHYVRRHACAALHALFAELGRDRPLVVVVEDVHWGDVDSAGLLFESVPTPHSMLLLMTAQDEKASNSPFLREMRVRWPAGAELQELAVGPLRQDESHSLALTLLGPHGEATLEDADTIARESGGSPFLIEELVRSVSTREWREQAAARPTAPVSVSLEKMVADRVGRLEPTTRRLLELVAVGGRPLEVVSVCAAAGVDDGPEEVVSQLRARRLVRTSVRDGCEMLEMSHNRITETILAPLSPETVREHHGRLSRMLESTAGADAEALAAHFLGAGDKPRAAEWAERAADQATIKLAFDQAVRLYKLAIGTLEEVAPASPSLARMRVRLGEADAHLSSVDLEGPLKDQVDALLRIQQEIDEKEQHVEALRQEAAGHRRRVDALHAAEPLLETTGNEELQQANDALANVTSAIMAVEHKLKLVRLRFQEAVADLPLDAAPAAGPTE